MHEVMAELQRLGTLDPAARDQLTADLQKTDPSLWPGILHQARAVAAYRQRMTLQQSATAGMPQGQFGASMEPPAAPPQYSSYQQISEYSPLRPPLQGDPRAAGGPYAAVGPYAAGGPYMAGDPRAAGGPYMAGGPAAQPIDRLPVSSSAAIPPRNAPGGRYPATGYEPLATAAAAASAGAAPVPDSPPVAAPAGPPPVTISVPNGQPAAPVPLDAGAKAEGNTAAPGTVEPADRNEAVPVSYVANEPLEWTEHVDSAIQALEKAAKKSPEDEMRLRMLYMAARQYDNAVHAIPGLPAGEQEFWTAQFHGLGTLLNSAKNPDVPSRTAESKQVLAEATSKLGELAPLVVRNLAFCTRVHSYGCVETFQSNKFTPEQRVLLYAEVDNFASESTARGHHTSLRSSYQIFDARGQRIADEELASTEELCQNRRHDFFVVYDFHLPKQIFPGKHTLRLTIEDLKGKKIGDSAIDFEIVSNSAR